MTKIGIVGLGLMGGSLAKALNRAGYDDITAVTRNEAATAQAISDGAISRGGADIGLMSDRGLVFVCVPVNAVADYVARLANVVPGGCIITDVGSVKAPVCQAVSRLDLRGAAFVGGHPMCGSEKGGYEAAEQTLYDGAKYILTPTNNDEAARRLADITRQIGAVPVIMGAEEHDRAVAAISHLPHAAAAALANAAAAVEGAEALAAGGFKDITRIASSDPALWQAIAAENRGELLAALRRFRAEITAFERLLADNDAAGLQAYFAAAKAYRDAL